MLSMFDVVASKQLLKMGRYVKLSGVATKREAHKFTKAISKAWQISYI